MPLRSRLLLSISFLTLFSPLLELARAEASLAFGLIDRKFPTFRFCPIETRNGQLITFVAPSTGEVRITFTAANEYVDDDGVLTYNEPLIDNVYVMPMPYWTGNAWACSDICFTNAPGATNFPGSSEILSELPYAEQFHINPHLAANDPWEGGTWSNTWTAPYGAVSVMYCEDDFAAGSLQLGSETAGNVPVSARLTVDGLTAGTTYVVFCWFRIRFTRESGAIPPATLAIRVDKAGAPTDVEQLAASEFSKLKAVPNPLGTSTVLSCAIANAGLGNLSVYDSRGRLVRRLFEGRPLDPGDNRFAWDSSDDSGAPLRAGVYFARLTTGAQQLRAKLLVMR